MRGWCLYLDDRWDGLCPQEDEKGFLVYASEASAYAAVVREVRARCDAFDAGQISRGDVRCFWHPMQVSLFADVHIFDDTNSEHYPRYQLDQT